MVWGLSYPSKSLKIKISAVLSHNKSWFRLAEGHVVSHVWQLEADQVVVTPLHVLLVAGQLWLGVSVCHNNNTNDGNGKRNTEVKSTPTT